MVGAVARDAAKSRIFVDFVGGFAIAPGEPSILYSNAQTAILAAMPAEPSPRTMRHIIAIHLQNEAGALTRVTGLFSTRGYNIESLSVAATDDPSVSRVTW